MMFRFKEKGVSGYTRFALGISTCHEECRKPHNVIHVAFFNRFAYIAIPEIIKPRMKWVDLSGATWATENANGVKGYWDRIRKDYGFSTFEGAIHFHYGIQPGCWSRDDKKNSDHTKVWNIPWLEKRFIRTSYYEPQFQTHLKTYHATKRGGIARNYLDDEYKFVESIPKLLIKFKDFDGQEITAKAHVEEREWRHGTGMFKWLSFFIKPTISRTLWINYNKETGYEKGTWKGGTCGEGIDIRKGEIVEDAFMRMVNTTRRYRNHGEKPRNFSNVEFSYE